MGMDVNGKAATSKTGEYFRNNAWWWRPLARYCVTVAPEVAAKCKHWQSNDGDGLDAEGSVALAAALQAELDAGRTAAFEKEYMAGLKAMPDEKCKICGGKGKRANPPVCGPGVLPCNGCDHTGKVRPSQCSYPFSAENVQEFVNFLRDCGGFEIN